MDRLLRMLGVGVTVALVAYCIVLLFGGSDVDDAVEDVIADAELGEADQALAERRRERIRMVGRQLAMSPDGEALDGEAISSEAPVSSVPYGSGQVDDRSAREGFEYAMGRVDTVVKSRRRLSQEDWDALYREANDAFSALSIVLDGSDEAQMTELEEAHKRLKQSLRKVRVRGRKFAH